MLVQKSLVRQVTFVLLMAGAFILRWRSLFESHMTYALLIDVSIFSSILVALTINAAFKQARAEPYGPRLGKLETLQHVIAKALPGPASQVLLVEISI